jgi:hypothetical protein
VCVWSCRKCGNSFTVTKVELVNSNLTTAAKNTGNGMQLLLYFKMNDAITLKVTKSMIRRYSAEATSVDQREVISDLI